MGLLLGFAAAGIAALGFGSNFVPCKQYDMGDGMTFQLVMALGIWLCGLIFASIEAIHDDSASAFHPAAMLGGVIWGIGNVCSVPIIKTVGMALGLAIWSSTSIIVGWITGKFGLFGTPKDTTVNIEWLNYVGIAIILISIIAFFQVSPNNDSSNDSNGSNSGVSESLAGPSALSLHDGTHHEDFLTNEKVQHPPKTQTYIFHDQVGHMESPAVTAKRFEFMAHTDDALMRKEYEREIENVQSWIDNLDPKHQTFLGVGLSIFAGICYGLVFCPIQYVMREHKHDPLYPQSLEKYSFEHYCGILLTSSVLFIGYAIYMRNEPQVNNSAIFPSLISGLVWGVAQICFFIAQDANNLGTDTSFPIVASSPQIVASVWGVFVFKEVTGGASLCKLVIAIAIELVGIACIALSKTDV